MDHRNGNMSVDHVHQQRNQPLFVWSYLSEMKNDYLLWIIHSARESKVGTMPRIRKEKVRILKRREGNSCFQEKIMLDIPLAKRLHQKSDACIRKKARITLNPLKFATIEVLHISCISRAYVMHVQCTSYTHLISTVVQVVRSSHEICMLCTWRKLVADPAPITVFSFPKKYIWSEFEAYKTNSLFQNNWIIISRAFWFDLPDLEQLTLSFIRSTI